VLGAAEDKQLRTELIHAVPAAGVSWTVLADRLPREPDPLVRIALLEMLGGYPVAELLPGDRQRLRQPIVELARTDPHPGVHSAAAWLLNRWGFEADVDSVRESVASTGRTSSRGWHVDPAGHTFAVIAGPVEFRMGADPDDPERGDVERRHMRRIPRTFGIGLHEVTVEQFQRFATDHVWNAEISPDPTCPVNEVSWLDAAKFCRWLSDRAGIPEDQMCFPPLEEIGPDMKLPSDVLERTGYRLPTAAEWEYACRAGAATSRPFGNSPDHTAAYAWFERNAANRTWPVGRLMPNDLGLFDAHGNVMEWCLDWYFDDYPEPQGGATVVIDGEDHRDGVYREIRGGAFDSSLELIRTPDRDYDLPFNKSFVVGFRIARTYRP
jgi:formylglycine-generating enzyme required for sulfatase activity